MITKPYVIYLITSKDSFGFKHMVSCYGEHKHIVNNGVLEIYNDDKLLAAYNNWEKFEIEYKTIDYPESTEESLNQYLAMTCKMSALS